MKSFRSISKKIAVSTVFCLALGATAAFAAPKKSIRQSKALTELFEEVRESWSEGNATFQAHENLDPKELSKDHFNQCVTSPQNLARAVRIIRYAAAGMES